MKKRDFTNYVGKTCRGGGGKINQPGQLAPGGEHIHGGGCMCTEEDS